MAKIHKLLPLIILFTAIVMTLLTRLIVNPAFTVQAAPLEINTTPTVLITDVTTESPSADEASSAPSEQCSIGTKFPASIQQWCKLITRYALFHGIDPNLIAAIILQESGGQADALSHSGAVGLMQVMPRDGAAAEFMCVNGPCFANRPSMKQLFDPDFNIQFGTGMLAGLISRYGSTRDALRAYGPMDRGYDYADIVLKIYANYQD